jgi:hypothetical protein
MLDCCDAGMLRDLKNGEGLRPDKGSLRIEMAPPFAAIRPFAMR